jgi:hypothetical protein
MGKVGNLLYCLMRFVAINEAFGGFEIGGFDGLFL